MNDLPQKNQQKIHFDANCQVLTLMVTTITDRGEVSFMLPFVGL